MYKISKLTGKLYFNDVEVMQDDRLQDFLDYLTYISNGGIVTEVDIIGNEVSDLSVLNLMKNETELYRKRQCDGVAAYAEISAEFRLAKLSGAITEAEHGAIETALIPVRNEVLAGQWISGRNLLEQIGISIGVELYDRLHLQLTNYINSSY